MALSTAFYNTFVKRNSVFVTSIFVGAFAFGVSFDLGIEAFWNRWNQGKQWKDIRHKYVTQGEE